MKPVTTGTALLSLPELIAYAYGRTDMTPQPHRPISADDLGEHQPVAALSRLLDQQLDYANSLTLLQHRLRALARAGSLDPTWAAQLSAAVGGACEAADLVAASLLVLINWRRRPPNPTDLGRGPQ